VACADNPEVGDFRHGRVPREVRERQILRLAEDLFTERGFAGASMDELAARAGVSKPVIYDIVGSKKALYERCFERAGDELAESIVEAAEAHAADPEAMLRATALAFLRFVEGHERAWSMLYAMDPAGRTDPHVQQIRARQAGIAADLLSRLGGAVKAPRLEAAAFMLNGAFEALASWRLDRPEISHETAAEWLVAFLLPGLKPLLGAPED
jgi:AcrR family transcriptional regulator